MDCAPFKKPRFGGAFLIRLRHSIYALSAALRAVTLRIASADAVLFPTTSRYASFRGAPLDVCFSSSQKGTLGSPVRLPVPFGCKRPHDGSLSHPPFGRFGASPGASFSSRQHKQCTTRTRVEGFVFRALLSAKQLASASEPILRIGRINLSSL